MVGLGLFLPSRFVRAFGFPVKLNYLHVIPSVIRSSLLIFCSNFRLQDLLAYS